MRLQRNITPDGKCKYAIVRLDKLRAINRSGPSPVDAELQRALAVDDALRTIERAGLLEYGEPGSPEECFTIKLKDQFCVPALVAYRAAINVEFTELMDAIAVLERYPNHATSAVAGMKNLANSLLEYMRDIGRLIERAQKSTKKIPD